MTRHQVGHHNLRIEQSLSMDAANCHQQKGRQLENGHFLLVLTEIQRSGNCLAILLKLHQLKIDVLKPLPPAENGCVKAIASIPKLNLNPNKNLTNDCENLSLSEIQLQGSLDNVDFFQLSILCSTERYWKRCQRESILMFCSKFKCLRTIFISHLRLHMAKESITYINKTFLIRLL